MFFSFVLTTVDVGGGVSRKVEGGSGFGRIGNLVFGFFLISFFLNCPFLCPAPFSFPFSLDGWFLVQFVCVLLNDKQSFPFLSFWSDAAE